MVLLTQSSSLECDAAANSMHLFEVRAGRVSHTTRTACYLALLCFAARCVQGTCACIAMQCSNVCMT